MVRHWKKAAGLLVPEYSMMPRMPDRRNHFRGVVWDSFNCSANLTLSSDFLTAESNSTNSGVVRATRGVSADDWYWEIAVISRNGGVGPALIVGIANALHGLGFALGSVSSGGQSGYGYRHDARKQGGGGALTSYGVSYNTPKVIGVELRFSSGELEFFVDDVSQGVAFTGISGTYYPAMSAAQLSPPGKATLRASRASQSYPTRASGAVAIGG